MQVYISLLADDVTTNNTVLVNRATELIDIRTPAAGCASEKPMLLFEERGVLGSTVGHGRLKPH